MKPDFKRPVLVSDFKNYIDSTSKMNFYFEFLNKTNFEKFEVKVPYVHRWHELYRKRVLARFYKLQNWWIDSGRPPVTMMTLTTYQDGYTSKCVKGHAVSIDESFEILMRSWYKLSQMLRKSIIGHLFDYVYILEHHESGYPHLHVCLFCTLTDPQKERVIKLWTEKYQAGSREHGAHFSEAHVDSGGDDLKTKTDINFIGFYLIKYLGKSFTEPAKMSKGQLKFSAYLWARGYRQYNTSRHLGQIMKLDTEPNQNLECLGVRLEGPSLDKEIYEMPKEAYDEMILSAYGKLMKDLEELGVIDGI